VLLSFGTPEEVREHCRKVIRGVAGDGGYIIDASAIMQNDTKAENLRAMTEAAREYGAYSGPAYSGDLAARPSGASSGVAPAGGNPRNIPGVCIPWEEKARELPPISGDPQLVRRVWENVDALGNMYIWQCRLSF
jgi:hypothetical protein